VVIRISSARTAAANGFRQDPRHPGIEPSRLRPRTDRLNAIPLGRRRRDRRSGAGYRDARADARFCASDPAGRGPDCREVSHSRRCCPPARARYLVDRDLARDPRHIGLAVVAISGLSYLTYLVQRYRPIKGGAILSALLSGAYSSTVTTVVLAKRASPQRPHTSCERSGRMRLSRPGCWCSRIRREEKEGTPASNT
jgi:hypothetical protein